MDPLPAPRAASYTRGLNPPTSPPVVARLASNLAGLRARIEAARQRSPRAADRVELLVVTKQVPVGLYAALEAAGVHEVAENRVQEAERRRPHAPPGWRWHGIGHLQRNKARRAVALFDVFHALDSLELARALDPFLRSGNRVWPVYIQVNAADDPRKGGIAPAEARSFVTSLADLPQLRPIGFMTLAPLSAAGADGGGSAARRAFRTLREVRDDVVRAGVGAEPPAGLSMGMSGDFEAAVEEGATVVRLGSAVLEGLDLSEPVGGRGPAGADA